MDNFIYYCGYMRECDIDNWINNLISTYKGKIVKKEVIDNEFKKAFIDYNELSQYQKYILDKYIEVI